MIDQIAARYEGGGGMGMGGGMGGRPPMGMGGPGFGMGPPGMGMGGPPSSSELLPLFALSNSAR